MPGLPERQYARLAAGVPGTVFFLEAPPVAERGGAPPVQGSTIRRYRLHERTSASFAANVADYAVSADGKKLVYRTPARPAPEGGGEATAPSLYLVDADGKAPDAGAGRLNATLRMELDPKAEFQQIFTEGWRYQRDYLYVPNQQGADWPAMKTMYGALLPHARHRADLTYLLDMMGGEIAIGHSYVRGGDLPDVPPTRVGLLGADTAIENGRYRFTRIYDGESWNPDLRAPLAAPGVDVAAGDYLLAVNGVELAAAGNLHQRLDGTVNQQTVLDGERAADTRRRPAGHGRAGGQRSGPADPGVGRGQPASRRQALGRPAGLRVRAQHRPARLRELQPLLLRAAGQARRGHRRALQRRRLGRRLHHRRARARLRRLLQQRRWRAGAVHQPLGRHLGAEGDDHQRDGRLGR